MFNILTALVAGARMYEMEGWRQFQPFTPGVMFVHSCRDRSCHLFYCESFLSFSAGVYASKTTSVIGKIRSMVQAFRAAGVINFRGVVPSQARNHPKVRDVVWAHPP